MFQAFWAIATLAIAVFILYESTDPSGPTLKLSTAGSYVGHYFAFALLAFCAMTACSWRSLRALLVILFGALIVAASLEVYQAALSQRTASVYDALAGLSGAMSGAALAFAILPAWVALGVLSPSRGTQD